MLLRSEYFTAMFSSPFREAQPSAHLPVVHVDCCPAVLTVILTYLYTEHSNFPLDVAIDVLFTADQLFIEKLKVKAAMIISTLGAGTATTITSSSTNPHNNNTNTNTPTSTSPTPAPAPPEDTLNIYDVIRAGWDTRVHRLEEFGARYIAYRLERYISEPEFRELVLESAARIKSRQETDTVELVDDVRYYLSERFRLRFEDTGFDELIEEGGGIGDEGEGIGEKVDELVAQQQGDAQPSMVIRTLDGEIAGDEFAQDAMNYQILLGKIDALLESLKLDA